MEAEVVSEVVGVAGNIVKMAAEGVGSFVRFNGHCAKEVLLFMVAKEQADPGWLKRTFGKKDDFVSIALSNADYEKVKAEMDKAGIGHFGIPVADAEGIINVVVTKTELGRVGRICEMLNVNALSDDDLAQNIKDKAEKDSAENPNSKVEETAPLENTEELEKENAFLAEEDGPAAENEEVKAQEANNLELLSDGEIVEDIKDPNFFVSPESKDVQSTKSSTLSGEHREDNITKQQDSFIYIEEKGSAWIVDYTGTGNVVTVPEKLGEADVYGIGAGTFKDSSVQQVILPGSVKVVADEAFKGSSVERINLDKVENIGNSAFAGCTNLQRAELTNAKIIGITAFAESGLSHVEIPQATYIPREAFRNCDKLQYCNAGKLQEVGYGAFIGCSSLNAIPDGDYRKISKNAFRNCGNLNSAEVSSDCHIGQGAFEGCTIRLINEKNEMKQFDSKPSARESAMSKTKINAAQKHVAARNNTRTGNMRI